MSEQRDWLEETWEIKHKFAERYAEASPSEQLQAMRDSILREWERRGWTLEPPPPSSLTRTAR